MYMPDKPVVKQRAITTKVCMVFDTSARPHPLAICLLLPRPSPHFSGTYWLDRECPQIYFLETSMCRDLLEYLVNIWCVRILCVVCTRLCIFKSSVIYTCVSIPSWLLSRCLRGVQLKILNVTIEKAFFADRCERGGRRFIQIHVQYQMSS